MLFTTPGQFQAARKSQTVPIGPDAEILMLPPTLAQLKTIEDSNGDISTVAQVFAALIVDEKGCAVFASAGAVMRALDTVQVGKISEFLKAQGDTDAAKKN